MKSPFDVPTRKVKKVDRCNFIKSNGTQCRCYHEKNSLFCYFHNKNGNTKLTFDSDNKVEIIECFHKNKKYIKNIKSGGIYISYNENEDVDLKAQMDKIIEEQIMNKIIEEQIEKIQKS